MKNSGLSRLALRTTEPPISWLMKLTLDHPKVISLAAGFTDNETLPVAEARALTERILRTRKSGQPALQYGSTAGDPRLRRLTAQHLQTLDTGSSAAKLSPAYAEDRVVITHGSQQFLYLTVEALCDEGDLVLVEDPTYFVFLGILQSHGVHARGIRLASDGIDVDQLARTLEALKRSGELKRVKMLYLVSYHQNPTGVTTRLAKKKAALALLRRYERHAGHPIYLLEDAAYRELHFSGEPVPSTLVAPGAAARVIYTSTYSKPFATGIRVGFGLLPEPVFTAVKRIKGNHDFGTANFLQQLLVQAITTGAYDRHLGELRRRYQRKARVMVTAMKQHFPAAVEWIEPGGGLYVWAKLPRSLKSGVKSAVFQKALAKDVLYVPGALCYADDPARTKPDCELRLSFGNASESDIRKGIERLGGILRSLLQ